MILEEGKTKKKRTKKPAKAEQEKAEQEKVEKADKEKTDEEISKEIEEILLLAQQQEASGPKVVSLYGDIDEDNARDVVHAMRILESGFTGEYEKDAFELLVSTNGGSALEMFSIYDTIRMIKEKAPVCTVGLGKVMSAGVLVLACGTKGYRKIGKNCRVMIHGVASGYAGSIHSLENELEEVQWIQQQYIKLLAAETDMTEKHIRKLISRKVNVYLTAEESVEFGIADEVF
jgi:ATP-dependent Clp endopeptidase proteolytic subunit ClpP|tara:strand:+ start:362 stop:1057 length:696 start_codon:yes stop_codon:yes gene_type:complete